MSSELAIRFFFLFLLSLFMVGFGHSGREHPTGYKVESPSFVHCRGVHFSLFPPITHLYSFFLPSFQEGQFWYSLI